MLGIKNIDREELQRRLRSLARRYNTLVERISEVELLADDIQLELNELGGSYRFTRVPTSESTEPGSARNRRRHKANGPRKDARDALRRTAEAGAHTLAIKPRSDGASDVRVDEGQIFSLPPLLADLLAVLALDNRMTEDQFVGWKSLAEIAILLKKKSGKNYSLHAVTQSIYRLRSRLYDRGNINPFLVQTNPRYGARFALKRKTVAVVTTAAEPARLRAIQDERRDECHTSG
jgi:hypothetical protein